MDQTTFDTLSRHLSATGSRRGAVGALAAGLGLGLAPRRAVDAKKRKKRKKGEGQERPKPKAQLDAACAIPAANKYGDANGNERWAQRFTPLASGRLARADLTLWKTAGSAGDYRLDLLAVDDAGVPVNLTLASATAPNDTVPAGTSKTTFIFAELPQVAAGVEYALALSRPGATQIGVWADAEGGCAGKAFHSTSQTGPFFPISPVEDEVDLLFATYLFA